MLWLTMIRWRGRQSSRDSVGDLQQFVCENGSDGAFYVHDFVVALLSL